MTFTTWLNQWWQKFDAMETGTAYEIAKCAKDGELFTEVCKDYIDKSPNGDNYTFSEDYKYFKKKLPPPEPLMPGKFHLMEKLPEGVRVEKINEGFTEYQEIKGRQVKLVHAAERRQPYVASYRIYDGEKLIAIET